MKDSGCKNTAEVGTEENKKFLSDQIITYLGNKRSLLNFIDNPLRIVKEELKKEKIDVFDVFSGSGIVARYLKQHSNYLIANDLEKYSYIINKCYLSNISDVDFVELDKYYKIINDTINKKGLIEDGFIYRLYSPKDDENIKKHERVFYTTKNAKYIDTVRQIIEKFPDNYKTLFLGPLLYEASTKTNTGGVFKGFYKNSKTKIGQFGGDSENCLTRIKGTIKIKKPILSNFNCKCDVYNCDANQLAKKVRSVDLAYLDPPYNQHPYGSNYFMLNLIADYKEPKEISKVSGIPSNWNKSQYNTKTRAKSSFFELCSNIKAKYLLISYNSEGFIKKDEMDKMLRKLGEVRIYERKYNVYRACKNLNDRSDIYVKEYLFLVRKR